MKIHGDLKDEQYHHPLLLKWLTSELQLAHSFLFYIGLLPSCLHPLALYSRKFAALCATMYLPINDLITPERLLNLILVLVIKTILYV